LPKSPVLAKIAEIENRTFMHKSATPETTSFGLQFWQLPDFGNSGNLLDIVIARGTPANDG
jgi:hypothetical protein